VGFKSGQTIQFGANVGHSARNDQAGASGASGGSFVLPGDVPLLGGAARGDGIARAMDWG
jgi:hypothetical protein